ncbi:MAG: ATP-binding cassette domain-containing protein [Desulfohalobiaceae bacterium]|nr:ATP-binding cassette domain-containing protein [Desulfohalobiaceae bacterium]
MNKQTPLLQIDNLQKHFSLQKGWKSVFAPSKAASLRAVDDITFELHPGEVLGFVGESGCGKSTMSRTLLRLIEPTQGVVRFQGRNILGLSRKEFNPYRRKMQLIFQDPFGSLNPRRTVAETIRQTINIHGLAHSRQEEAKLIERTLDLVGLKPIEEYWDKYPTLLSGGQLQRVSIARVLVLQPEFIIADEPVSMLDVSVRIGILELLQGLQKDFNISFLYITHDMITARHICDRIAIMYLGRIVEIGEADDIIQSPLHPYTQALMAAVPVPDPTAAPPNLPIKGYVPTDPKETVASCNFIQRCPYAVQTCRTQKPELRFVNNRHQVACFRLDF